MTVYVLCLDSFLCFVLYLLEIAGLWFIDSYLFIYLKLLTS